MPNLQTRSLDALFTLQPQVPGRGVRAPAPCADQASSSTGGTRDNEEAPPEPQLTQAQLLRMQLAQHAQEQRARAHLRMVNPIRKFYGLQ